METAAVGLYEPINTLKPVGDNIWIVDGPIVQMQMYGTHIPFPTRMTVIRLANGDLFVHSPIELTDGLKAEIDGLGRVQHLVSPNKLHYAAIAPWGAVYPAAIKWASPGVRQRAAAVGIPVSFDRDLGEQPDVAWADEIDQLIVHGSRFFEEVVFFHRATRTLILTDLIENFERDKLNGPWAWIMALSGAADPDGKAPIDMRLTFWGRKQQARVGVEQMLAWQPDKVILAHGRWYDRDGTGELKRAFRWLLR
ncbi:DUF4336 domain-containing protein [Nodosilinea nodulosa]|uniref:DUF4336 domain-containing protein n=1 Tax=Nodosilinea nodulosa TaxID=416001 RepID=UPI0003001BB9|nr:DUF4336 domain-containing protein [Nodosilinea nodulosa]